MRSAGPRAPGAVVCFALLYPPSGSSRNLPAVSTVLIGYRGSGKSTIGARLADRLWQKFVDTDDLIAQKAQSAIAEIFAAHGEAHFRQLELQAVRDALAMEDHIVSLGGGAVMQPEVRDLLRSGNHRVVYLKCEPKELLRRIQSDPTSNTTRPPLTALGGGIDEIGKVLAEREPIYRQVMHAELDVTNLTPEDAVIYITRLI
jgi:shikimate kinase